MVRALRFVGIATLAGVGAALCITSAFDRTGDQGAVIPLATGLASGPIIKWRLAAQAIQARQIDRAAALVREVVLRDPVRADGPALLGVIDVLRGDTDKARAAYLVSGAMGWREPLTQTYWLNDGLATGDVTVVAQRLDALRRTGVSSEIVSAASLTLEQLPEGRAAIARQLENTPNWVDAYVDSLPSLSSEGAIAARIATVRLAKAHGLRPDCRKIGGVAKTLAVQSRYGEAANLWFSICRPTTDVHAGLTGTGFTRADDEVDTPFAWTLAEQGDIDVQVQQAPAQTKGDALSIQSNSTTMETAAQRLVALRPGPYRLGWRIAADDPSRSDLATVSITCAGSHTALEATAVAKPAARPGSTFYASTVVIPASGCTSQWVAIVAEPKTLDTPARFSIFDIETRAANALPKPAQ